MKLAASVVQDNCTKSRLPKLLVNINVYILFFDKVNEFLYIFNVFNIHSTPFLNHSLILGRNFHLCFISRTSIQSSFWWFLSLKVWFITPTARDSNSLGKQSIKIKNFIACLEAVIRKQNVK